jgi:HPt (histidine-containing phosphotransfer) domain-containing protein
MSVPQNDLADDFNWSSRSACMGGCMTPEIMGAQIDPNHFARLIDHHPGGIVGDRENTLFRFNSLISDIFSHSVCDLLGNEHDFGFPATFGVWQCDFPVFDIDGSYFENFTDLQKWIKPSEKRVQGQQPQIAVERPESDQAMPKEEELPESLPGFDLKDGLKRLQGNKRLYRKLLLSFATDYCGTAKDIRGALDAKDFDRAHSLVHNLKGLAGNLAAADLQAAAIEIEKLVKGDQKQTPPVKQLNQKLARLENTLNQALESVQTLGISVEDKAIEPLDVELAGIAAELSQDIVNRIRDAAEMGDVKTLNAIAEEIKSYSDSCVPLSKKIIQMAEDFEFEGILKLADELDAC